MTARSRRVAALALAALLLLGCSGDDGDAPSTTTTAPSTTTTTGGGELAALLLTPEDLPDGFVVDDLDLDTVTTFCVGQDAAAGLQAADRAIVTFSRTAEGAGVVQIVFRFENGAAPTFVAQATQLFEACHEVPDAQGLAFAYDEAAPAVEEALAGTTSHAARNGTSVGSGSLLTTTAVFQVGEDVAQLVGVLGLDVPRAELDELAVAAIGAAVDKATG